jgi:hexokinase
VYQGAPLSTRQPTEHNSHTRHRTTTGSLAFMQTNNHFFNKTISQVSTDGTQQFIRGLTRSRISQPAAIHRVLKGAISKKSIPASKTVQISSRDHTVYSVDLRGRGYLTERNQKLKSQIKSEEKTKHKGIKLTSSTRGYRSGH